MQLDDYYKYLYSIGTAIQQSLQLDEILDSILNEVMPIFEIPVAEIFIYDENANLLMIKAHRGMSPELVGTGLLHMGEGLAGSIAERKEPLFVNVLDSATGIPPKIIKKESLVSYAGIPLLKKQNLIGVLGLYTHVVRTFTSEEQQLLSEIGEIAGQAIYNGLIYQDTSLRAQRFIAVSRAITVTQKIDNLASVLENLSKVVVQSLGFDGAWIGMVNEDTNQIEGQAGFGIGLKAKSSQLQYDLDSRLKDPINQTLVMKAPLVFQFQEDIADESFRKWMIELKVESVGLVPIISSKKVLGVMAAFFCHDQSIDEGGLKALTSVAEQTAIVIENARLYEKTKQSEAQYRNLFESAGPSLVIIDRKKVFQLVNYAFENLCGYKRKDLIGKRTLDLFLNTEGNQVLPDPTQSGHFEAEFTNRSGEIKQIHVSSTSVPGTANILVSIIDMTPQRELERRLFRSEELAAIGELSAGIAHEIRNPLVAIKTSVGLLQDEPDLSDEGHQLLEVVSEETNQMAAIIEDFLQFARPKPPSFEDVEINQVIKDVIKRYKDIDNGKVIRWIENVDKSMPLLWLDRYQIQQVITNLVLNGMDAIESKGDLEIASFMQEESNLQKVACIAVSDTGNGIQAEYLNKIFQPFFSTKEKGTGMGLAICRRIIDQHGGEIRVESESGRGTRFSVLIPMKKH